MQFDDVVAARRSTRDFLPDPVPRDVIERCVDLASRAPSAGKSQGWNLVAFEGPRTEEYWARAFPHGREGFTWPGILAAPFIALSLADPRAYLERYSEADKSRTGWGEATESWPAPYWTIDAAFATMTFILALENEGYGTLFFAHANEADLREAFSIPDDVVILGAIAAGRPGPRAGEKGRSAARPRRSVASILRTGRW